MHISFVRQAFSFAGALLVLIGYIGHQLKWMDSRKFSYNALNAAGSGILAYIAFSPFQLGFVVMEVTWVAVSVYALLRSWETE
ncbi:MAG: CBU_0592 family membrane protein [Terriglobales bacterium]